MAKEKVMSRCTFDETFDFFDRSELQFTCSNPGVGSTFFLQATKAWFAFIKKVSSTKSEVTSEVGWTTAIVSCMASSSVKFQNFCRVQKAATHIALDLSKFSHITPALRQLHWLPVVKRIQFKKIGRASCRERV